MSRWNLPVVVSASSQKRCNNGKRRDSGNTDEKRKRSNEEVAGMELMGMTAICKHVKMSHSIVLSWIREAGFPARKICGRGKWMSDTDEITAWLKEYVAGRIHENASAPPEETKKSGKQKRSRI